MPVSKHKRTTSQAPFSTSEPSAPPLPEQQAFHQHLRSLAQSAVRTVIELVMRKELDAFIGAAWGECNPNRKGHRNKGIGALCTQDAGPFSHPAWRAGGLYPHFNGLGGRLDRQQRGPCRRGGQRWMDVPLA